MKKLSGFKIYRLLTLFFFSAISAFAEKGESSRVLVHTLNYISHDYQFAVKGGQVINKDEYKEAQEFGESALKYFNECSGQWAKDDSITIRQMVYRLDSLIDKQASFELVSPLATDARNKVLAASGLKITPSSYPSLENGKIIYRTECASCHGDRGKGDGPQGVALNPKPRDFYDNDRMKSISAFFAFNTVRLGINGTGMLAHNNLKDEEVWDVTFYILSLRFEKYKNDPFLKDENIKVSIDSISLDRIATISDEEFLKSMHIADSTEANLRLAALRLNQPMQGNSEFIQTSLKYLEGAMTLYNQGKYKEASQMATLSYLEGIEPVEMQIKASDPQLMNHLEMQMQLLRRMMEQQKPAAEVQDSVTAARKTIAEATQILDKKEYSFWLALLMALSILLREGLEAFLVIMVILSIIKATHLKSASGWVHGGWIGAILLGIVLWMIGGSIIKQQMQHVELMEGIISVFAVGMLLYVGFWLHGKSEMNRWRDYVSKMMKGVVSKESLWGLAGLSFFVVFREVFESVLFISALNIESGGKQSHAIISGVVIAFIIVLVFAFFVLKFSTRLPIPKLFRISSLVMGMLAVVLGGKGIHSFQELGMLPIHGVPVPRIELIGVFPTLETCAAQLLVLIVLIVVWNISSTPKKTL